MKKCNWQIVLQRRVNILYSEILSNVLEVSPYSSFSGFLATLIHNLGIDVYTYTRSSTRTFHHLYF